MSTPVTAETSEALESLQSPLCKDCRTALDRWGSEKDIAKAGDGRPSRGPPETILLQANSRLKERVATGCRLCAMVYDSFEGETGSFESTTFRRKATDDPNGGPDPEVWGYVRSWRSGGPPNDKYSETDLSIRRWRPNVEMKWSARLHRVKDRTCTDCSDGTPRDIQTRNPPPWDLMRTWLKDCIDNHQGACKSAGLNFLPTRLLNVGTLNEPQLRIQLRDKIPPGSNYLTLSHCWGPIVPKRLLLENLEQFRQEIPTEGLSRTFQDAIYASRKLGEQHIWIDSLCIIQNSSEDWQKEAAMMGQVYASGLCNLAATAATEGSQGLFLDKLPVPQVQIDIDGTNDLWHLNENPGYHWGSILNFAPLNWRGWVFQERFLSTRVIHFGRSRVYWECGQKKCCEWPDKGTERDLSATSWTDQSKSFWQEILKGSGKVEKDEAVKIWNAIIDYYTSHSTFTYITDKLVAIGGLASRVQKSTQCRYLAGLWEHDLPSQLMWDVGKGHSDDNDSSHYVAPSWSWASVHVPIGRYFGGRVKYVPSTVIEVRDIDIQLATGNELGQVKGGSLTLVGRLGLMKDMDVLKVGEDGEWRFDGVEVRLDRRNRIVDASSQQLYLLLVEDQRKDESYEGAGLVLQHLETNENLGEENVFKRAGFFRFWFNKTMKNTIAELQENFDGTALAKQVLTESEKDEKSRHLIKII
ncbi:HET-domain-containing protein [Mollisia scopiformis]|uniref:HET-domain-containing protein n=1 Tax=Mollisia scopiformis TaxID=149040 RepID=A0A132BCH7_MOLSC|nr:HET-domain-containing protein [Mollisia scopiformis]KUJ10078.1 HET-domain-containing protein [Mollisia scopiformis]